MSNIIFSTSPNGANLGYYQDNMSALKDIPTNIASVSQSLLVNRFYADIVKDAHEPPRVTNIVPILNTVWPAQVTITNSNYKILLNECENALQPSIRNKETVLNNILKTSTVGSNTKISLAENAIWESGMGPNKICMKSDVQVWKTPASDLDTLPKGNPPGVKYWPLDNINSINFNSSWHYRMGFPNNVGWSWSKTDDVQIQYGNDLIISKTQIDDSGGVMVYANGNKNDELNSTTLNINVDYKRFLLLAKEYGDVAQVWMYFAFVAIQSPNSIMITTDSVVYFMCALLNLSCVYTGGRKGVESGNCSLKHYLSGTINLNDKIQTMLKIQYDRVLAHNTAIKISLNIMLIDFNKFEYFRDDNGRIKRTYGSYQVTPEKKLAIQSLIKSRTEIIDANNIQLETNYNSIQNQIPASITDDVIDSIYNTFYNISEGLKIPQWITKLPNKNYVLNPGDFLSAFGEIVGVNVPGIPEQINIINPSNLDSNEPLIRGGKNKKASKNFYSFGKNTKKGGGSKGSYENIGYYESVIMLFTYVTIFDSFPNTLEEISSNFKTNSSLAILFACKYDIFSRNFQDIISNDIVSKLLEKYEDNNIISIGDILSELIYFADDVNVEIHKLTEEFNYINANIQAINIGRVTRSSKMPIYSPILMNNSRCDNTFDTLGNRIGQGMGIVINGKCYDIRNLLKFYKNFPDNINYDKNIFIDFQRTPITDPVTIDYIKNAMQMVKLGQLQLSGGKKHRTRKNNKHKKYKRKSKTARNTCGYNSIQS
jgi:hypothetical protein